jgi:hypothetical protein
MNVTQTSPTGSPVINFANAGATRKPTRRDVAYPPHPDAILIAACIEYASYMAFAAAGYAIDPTDADFAAVSDDAARAKADTALRIAQKTCPETLDGLRAKSALVYSIAGKNSATGSSLGLPERMFLASLADNIRHFHDISAAKGEERKPVTAPA